MSGPIEWVVLAPTPKCDRCNGTGSAAPRIPGLLNYVMCRSCGGTGKRRPDDDHALDLKLGFANPEAGQS